MTDERSWIVAKNPPSGEQVFALDEKAAYRDSMQDALGPRKHKVVVKNEQRLGKGNGKLKGILIWDLPAVTTCPVCSMCKSSCFAINLQRIYTNVRKWRNMNLALWIGHRTLLEGYLDAQIVKNFRRPKPFRSFRWHSSGDLFSQEYIEWCAKITKRYRKHLVFYGYTKADGVFDVRPLVAAGASLVRSLIPMPGGSSRLNYASPEYFAPIVAQYPRIRVCPATYGADAPLEYPEWPDDVQEAWDAVYGPKCGNPEDRHGGDCFWCSRERYALFVEHGTVRSRVGRYVDHARELFPTQMDREPRFLGVSVEEPLGDPKVAKAYGKIIAERRKQQAKRATAKAARLALKP